MDKPPQKYALITGASSGIGYAMSQALSKRGYKVYGCAPKRDLHLMTPLKQQYGVTPFELDITDLQAIKNAVQYITKETGGRLDILYNNAGISIGGPAVEHDEQKLNLLFQVNVIGHMNMCKHFVDLVIATKGVIVFTSSIAGLIPLSWASHYNASKAAINMYAKTLAPELKPFGVKVYSVITGGVNTAICDLNKITSAAGSHYDVDGIYESINANANMSRRKGFSESPTVYAEGIAKKITNTNKYYGFNLYKGAMGYSAYLASLVLPLWLLNYGIAFHFKQLRVMRNVRKMLRGEYKEE